jgi:hypothetical protein
MAVYLKCSCNYCDGHIEFPPELLGTEVECPHCAKTTTLAQTAPPPILPTQPQLRKKPGSKKVWIIAASVGGCVMFFIIFLLLINTKSSQPDQIETELKAHLSTFRDTFGRGSSYELIQNEKNTLVNYYRQNKTSLTNYTTELDEICMDLDSAIVPWKDDVPEAEFQRRADIAQHALDNIAILIERLSHDDERLERAKNWKASQDVERAERARQRGDDSTRH